VGNAALRTYVRFRGIVAIAKLAADATRSRMTDLV
jgi:hypothetical protein